MFIQSFNQLACTIAIVLLFSGISISSTSAQENREQTPNIVMIMADDLGYECLNCYGGTSYETPNLNRLAQGGIRFNHCYSQPLCTPTRVQLMTGQYNVRNYERFGLLPSSQLTFGNLLRSNGYATCIAGKWQLGGSFDGPGRFGFDEYCLWQLNRRPERFPNPGLEINGELADFTNGEYGPDVCCNFACDFIRKNSDKPFLVYYPMILTHCPFCPTPDSADWDPASEGSPTYKGDAKYFGDMVAYMDKLVGRIDQTLDEAGVRENTLVMFIGDNGTDRPVVSMIGDAEVAGDKNKTTDGGTRVPCIASWPGTIPSGQVSDELVDTTDFLPTMLEAAGLEAPDTMITDGRSLLPFLKGEEGQSREWIYVWYSRQGGETGQQFTRNQKYKLNLTGEFFDIENDPLEQSPLSEERLSEDQQQTRAMLQQALDQFADARPPEVSARGSRQQN